MMVRKGLCAFLRPDGTCLVRRSRCIHEHDYAPCPDAVRRTLHSQYSNPRKMHDLHLETAIGRFKHHTQGSSRGKVYWECARKSRYRTGNDASRAAKKMEMRYGTKMYYYYCRYCEGYHLTKKAPREIENHEEH